jgi:hypothetical protein
VVKNYNQKRDINKKKEPFDQKILNQEQSKKKELEIIMFNLFELNYFEIIIKKI